MCRYEEGGGAYMELSNLTLARNYKQKEVSFWLSLLPRDGLEATECETRAKSLRSNT